MSFSSLDFPYRSVVRITNTIGGQSWQSTGVLIAPNEVLTASHVVAIEGVGTATNITVTPGYNNGTAPFGSATGDSFHRFPVNNANETISFVDSQSDFAVIHLSTSFTNVGTMDLLPGFTGGAVSITGYPVSAGGAQVNAQQVVVHDPTYSLLDSTPLGPGISGGPLWVQGANGPEVVGIASSEITARNIAFNALLTSDIANQIRAWVAQDNGAATTSQADLVLQGSHTQYTVAANPAGGAVVTDSVSGRDGTKTSVVVHDIVFADGTGRFDATGNAEDCARLYKAAFGRAADATGLDYWTSLIDHQSVGLADVAAAFVGSSEFSAHYSTPDNAAFIHLLYRNVLGRAADPSGLQYWVSALDDGTSRAQVLAAWSDGFENKANSLSTIGDKELAETYRLYQAAFDRVPDRAGLQAWTAFLDRGNTPASLAQTFASTPEFAADFGAIDDTGYVNRLFSNVLHRAGDAAGVQYWTGQLGLGVSRAQVLLGIADSLENRQATAAATHDGWLWLT
jgi:V8-like Glu-specific endopeptidase